MSAAVTVHPESQGQETHSLVLLVHMSCFVYNKMIWDTVHVVVHLYIYMHIVKIQYHWPRINNLLLRTTTKFFSFQVRSHYFTKTIFSPTRHFLLLHSDRRTGAHYAANRTHQLPRRINANEHARPMKQTSKDGVSTLVNDRERTFRRLKLKMKKRKKWLKNAFT